jgi:integrase
VPKRATEVAHQQDAHPDPERTLSPGALRDFHAGERADHRQCRGGTPNRRTWAIERAVRDARSKVEGLPTEFRFHDLRHYFASLLIASGLDVKVVQARLRHASAKTTLDTYGHLWPDKDESSRAAVAAVYAARPHAEGGRAASGSA